MTPSARLVVSTALNCGHHMTEGLWVPGYLLKRDNTDARGLRGMLHLMARGDRTTTLLQIVQSVEAACETFFREVSSASLLCMVVLLYSIR